ncbi:MAG: hypothetical protein GEU79_05390, partial [Acidimicrobiia bacterium]|nr:hypothetical protein [Acidimicrobiia bacterium]
MEGAGSRPERHGEGNAHGPRRHVTHFLVVANAAAGSTEQDGVRRAVGIIAESGTVSLRWTEPEDDLDALVTELAPDAIVIAAGDGSIHHVANALGTETLSAIPFGIIPSAPPTISPGVWGSLWIPS